MSNKDDILSDLLSSKPSRKRQTGVEGVEKTIGISSLELLTLPEDQRKVLNWLSRQREATFTEIREALNLSQEEADRILKELRAANYTTEAVHDGNVYYRIVFRSSGRKKAQGVLGALWARVDVDQVSFLQQHPLFEGLSKEQVQGISKKIDERIHYRDEVIMWQGDVSDYIYFIKSGVVGISRFDGQEQKIFSYIKTGDILGENNVLLRQGGAATATATALSTVVVLMMKKNDFVELLNTYPTIALELARLLVQRLIATNNRFANQSGAKLCLVIGTGTDVGATSIGVNMAMTLAQTTRKNTGYTELPNPERLASRLETNEERLHHSGNFDIVLTQDSPGLPASLRATLAFDRLMTQYENVVIGLSTLNEEILTYLAEYADQIIVVTSPDPERIEEFNRLNSKLRSMIHPEKVSVFYVVNRTKPEHKALTAPPRIDFDLPYTENMPSWVEHRPDNRPQLLAVMTTSLADRLGRANQVSIFIPTTVDVNQVVDTGSYVERTLAFLGERFGGATTNQARGVWNSNDAGLVGEDIFIVRSYATQDALDEHLQSILDYVEQLKKELRQEAMAVEINQKLMLI